MFLFSLPIIVVNIYRRKDVVNVGFWQGNTYVKIHTPEVVAYHDNNEQLYLAPNLNMGTLTNNKLNNKLNFYSAFQGTSQSALHRRKDWEKTIITIKSKINIFHMTQENHLKAILKKICFKNRFKNTKRFSLSDLRRKRVPEFWRTRRKGPITHRP